LLSANVFVEISSLQKSESYTNGLLRLLLFSPSKHPKLEVEANIVR